MEEARRKMVKVRLQGLGTLHHAVDRPAWRNQGLHAAGVRWNGCHRGRPQRTIFEVVGVTNILAKCHGSTNPYNLVRATINALENCNGPADIAAKRGLTVEEQMGAL